MRVLGCVFVVPQELTAAVIGQRVLIVTNSYNVTRQEKKLLAAKWFSHFNCASAALMVQPYHVPLQSGRRIDRWPTQSA